MYFRVHTFASYSAHDLFSQAPVIGSLPRGPVGGKYCSQLALIQGVHFIYFFNVSGYLWELTARGTNVHMQTVFSKFVVLKLLLVSYAESTSNLRV